VNIYKQIVQNTKDAIERGVVREHKTDGYNSQVAPVTPPAAAQFNKGARDLSEIREAADRRREHSAKLCDPSRAGWKPQSPHS
jgi:hypothetical protein